VLLSPPVGRAAAVEFLKQHRAFCLGHAGAFVAHFDAPGPVATQQREFDRRLAGRKLQGVAHEVFDHLHTVPSMSGGTPLRPSSARSTSRWAQVFRIGAVERSAVRVEQ
jgi:hypothetical protein